MSEGLPAPVAAPGGADRRSERLLRRLEWRVRDSGDNLLGGEYRSAFRGRGREFDQVVRYEWGDDVRDIDWNVTARLGEPYRKKFVEERELTVAIVFEDSPSLQFGSAARRKRDALLEVAGYLGLIAAANRDRAGVWYAGPEEQWARMPVRGRGPVARSVASLLEAPEPRLDARPFAVDWRRLASAFPRHSVLAWLGDFPPAEGPPGWRALCRRYEVIGIRVEDPFERELPEVGAFTAMDPASGEAIPLDPRSRSVRRRHAAWVEERDAVFRGLFPRDLNRVTVSTDADPLDSLAALFRARMRALKR